LAPDRLGWTPTWELGDEKKVRVLPLLVSQRKQEGIKKFELVMEDSVIWKRKELIYCQILTRVERQTINFSNDDDDDSDANDDNVTMMMLIS